MRRRSVTAAGADEARTRVELELLASRVLNVQRKFRVAAMRAMEDAAKYVAEQTRELQEEWMEANRALLAAADSAGLVTRMEWTEDGQLRITFDKPRPAWVLTTHRETWGPQLYLDMQRPVADMSLRRNGA